MRRYGQGRERAGRGAATSAGTGQGRAPGSCGGLAPGSLRLLIIAPDAHSRTLLLKCNGLTHTCCQGSSLSIKFALSPPVLPAYRLAV